MQPRTRNWPLGSSEPRNADDAPRALLITICPRLSVVNLSWVPGECRGRRLTGDARVGTVQDFPSVL
jgi:hypothetical protein